MLVLSRRPGEVIVIGEGEDAVRITIVDAGYGRVRVGVIAPKTVPIRRGELPRMVSRRLRRMVDIKIITEPAVYVLGRQTVDTDELNRFLGDHGVTWESDSEIGAEVVSETAGRVCYMSFARPRPGGNAAYLAHIKEVGHGSVLEHAVWNFLFTGVSRSLTHELIRHRAGMAYSQLSQRYVDESVAEYVEPDIIAADEELHAEWLSAVDVARFAYARLVALIASKLRDPQTRVAQMVPTGSPTDLRKAARQAARSVLPNATETKIFVTANARALRHFLEQRGSSHAEPEIRKLANKLLEVLRHESPNLFSDYRTTPLPDGTFEITTDFRKV